MTNAAPDSPRSWSEAEIAEILPFLTEAEKAELDALLAPPDDGRVHWKPFPGPQQLAFDTEADELFYGGAAGGGKTDLVLGLALTQHRHSIIFRREYPQLKGIVTRSQEIIGNAGRFNSNDKLWKLRDGRRVELGAVQHEDDKQNYQGRPHDLKAFDELPHFTRSQYEFLIAWTRTSSPGQRCRVVSTGNPPVPGQDGAWIIEAWAPWLDPEYPNPADPGELRWYAMLDGQFTWVESGEPFQHTDLTGRVNTVRPRSRTFIKALVDDNPVYMATGYDAILESLPEPLRSQLRYGDFNATAEDDPWQVIPTAWALAAIKRGRAREAPDVTLSALGVDVARGGKDQTALAPRFGDWFGQVEKHRGITTDDGPKVAALVVSAIERGEKLTGCQSGTSGAVVNIDAVSVGTSPLDILKENGVRVQAINFGESAKDEKGKPRTDKSKKFKFKNVRAWAYWSFREALDPTNGEDIALPDDRELLGDLCAARYRVVMGGIAIESKDEIKKRISRSPDCGDAVVQAALPIYKAGPVKTETKPSSFAKMNW